MIMVRLLSMNKDVVLLMNYAWNNIYLELISLRGHPTLRDK